MTVYFAYDETVLHLSRYFLDILFSGEEVWKHVEKIYATKDKTDTFVIYINYKTFLSLYMQCVGKVTYGDKFTLTLQAVGENQ